MVKRVRTPPNGFLNAVDPVFKTSRVFGFHPSFGEEWSLSLATASLFCLALLTLFSGVSLKIIAASECAAKSCVVPTVHGITLTLANAFCALAALSNFRRLETKRSCGRIMDTVDSMLNQYGLCFTYKKKWAISFAIKSIAYFILLTIISVKGAIYIAPGIYSIFHLIALLLPFAAQIVMIDLVTRQMSVLLYYANEHFRFITMHTSFVWGSLQYSGRCEKLEMLLSCYDMLCDFCDVVDRGYGEAVLFIMPAIFICLVSALLFFYWALIAKFTLWETPIYSLTILMWLWPLWDLSSITQRIENKAKEFSLLIYIILANDLEKGFLHNEKFQLHLIRKRKIEFSTGLFPLDHTLLHSVAAAVVTYFIILIKFKNPFDNLEM